MTTQKALVIVGTNRAEVITNRPRPALPDDCILVKTVAVALNPADWKLLSQSPPVGALLGFDYSGTVQQIGKTVTQSFKIGDRVFGYGRGANSDRLEDGTFAEYIIVKGDLQIRIPEHLTFEEAATMGVALYTAGQGLIQNLGLPFPDKQSNEATPILIYGGSSATGAMGIQLARLCGYTPLTTCSKHNFDYVLSLGAAAVFDYKDPECGMKIREHTKDSLALAWDTISEESSALICAKALSSSGGLYGSLGPSKCPRDDVQSNMTIGTTLFGEELHFGDFKIPAMPDHLAFAKKLAVLCEDLLAEKKIKPLVPRVMNGGLRGAAEGLELLRQNQVSAQKLVYRVADTA
jgi:NADPH:quinone reductase-like Zn-dependent oxidoreductase